MSYPGTPVSATVGTFGAESWRLAVVTASARNWPASTSGSPEAITAK
jgi:hypothetical protein